MTLWKTTSPTSLAWTTSCVFIRRWFTKGKPEQTLLLETTHLAPCGRKKGIKLRVLWAASVDAKATPLGSCHSRSPLSTKLTRSVTDGHRHVPSAPAGLAPAWRRKRSIHNVVRRKWRGGRNTCTIGDRRTVKQGPNPLARCVGVGRHAITTIRPEPEGSRFISKETWPFIKADAQTLVSGFKSALSRGRAACNGGASPGTRKDCRKCGTPLHPSSSTTPRYSTVSSARRPRHGGSGRLHPMKPFLSQRDCQNPHGNQTNDQSTLILPWRPPTARQKLRSQTRKLEPQKLTITHLPKTHALFCTVACVDSCCGCC